MSMMEQCLSDGADVYYEHDGALSVRWGRYVLRAWWSSVCQMGQICITSMTEQCLSDGADMYYGMTEQCLSDGADVNYEHGGVVSVRWGRCELRT